MDERYEAKRRYVEKLSLFFLHGHFIAANNSKNNKKPLA